MDKEIRQYTEETNVVSGDWYLMQKGVNDQTVKVDSTNILPGGGVTQDKLNDTARVQMGQVQLTGTGNTVINCGYNPKYIKFQYIQETTISSAGSAYYGTGLEDIDAGTRYAIAVHARDTQGTGGLWSANYSIMLNSVAGGTSSTGIRGTVSATSSTGFTINITDWVANVRLFWETYP